MDYLYSETGQRLAAQHHYRPAETQRVPEAERQALPAIELFTIDKVFGGWRIVQPAHFDDGGIFDRLLESVAGKEVTPPTEATTRYGMGAFHSQAKDEQDHPP